MTNSDRRMRRRWLPSTMRHDAKDLESADETLSSMLRAKNFGVWVTVIGALISLVPLAWSAMPKSATAPSGHAGTADTVAAWLSVPSAQSILVSILFFLMTQAIGSGVRSVQRRLDLEAMTKWVIEPLMEDLYAKDVFGTLPRPVRHLNIPNERAMLYLALRRDLQTRHSLRQLSLSKFNWVNIYNFDAMYAQLFKHTFALGTSRHSGLAERNANVVRDYSVAWNAGHGFVNHDQASYFRDVFNARRRYRNCGTTIRFLVMVDFPEELLGEKDLPDFSRQETMEAFAEALKELFNCFCKEFSWSKDDPLWKIYEKAMSSEAPQFAAVRLITPSRWTKVEQTLDYLEQPFNVYSDLAISRSVISSFRKGRDIPHLRVSLREGDIDFYARKFDKLWGAAGTLPPETLFGSDEKLGDLSADKVKTWLTL